MKLTKEECLNALGRILFNVGVIRSDYRTSGKAKEDYCTLKSLIEEHFENPQIDWLKNCMGEEAFNLIFSSQEEVNKWFDRMRWHVKKCDEYGRELDILKNNPPLKFDELNKGYPIYDNDEIVCGWKLIYMIDKEYKQLLLIDEEGNVDWVNYEENRFYRKEVQE